MMSEKEKSLRPIDYPYPFQSTAAGHAYRIILPTLVDLVAFWNFHRTRFLFAATATEISSGNVFMREHEWFFAESVPILMRAVMRWDALGTQVVKNRYVLAEPEFSNISKKRPRLLQNCRSDIEYWSMVNAPLQMTISDLVTSHFDGNIKKTLSVNKAAEKIQIAIFFHWHREGQNELDFFDSKSLERYIQYWEDEKKAGQDYYGMENE